MHIDKHDKKIIYSYENILNKGPMKMIWSFLVPNYSLRWFLVVPPKFGFALMKIKLVAQSPHGGMLCSSKMFHINNHGL
jgi:hypothetical protein